MNKRILILTLTFSTFFASHVFAQAEISKTIKLSTGFGYYNPGRTGETGNLFFSKILFKLPSGIFIGGEFATSLVFNTLDVNVPTLANQRSYDNFYLYSLHVEKPFLLGKKKNQELAIASGLIYESIRFARIDFVSSLENPGTLVPVINRSDSMQDEAGSFIELNYHYNFSKLSVGLKARTHLLLNIGISELILAPTISLSL